MESNRPILSVIVPVYNAVQYLEECVESILKQKYLSLEIILVDDGSVDQSGAICDLLSERNICVTTLHIKNGGITKARLTGVRASCGEWITFIDADDWIGENAYRDISFENNCDVVVTGICRYFDEKKFIMQMPYFKEGLYDKKKIINEIIPIMLWNPRQGTWALDPSLCTKIFRREIILKWLEEASQVGSNYGEDSIVIFPMILQAESVRIINRIYYFHRQRVEGEIPSYIKNEEYILKLHNVYTYLSSQFKKMGYGDIMRSQLDCFYIDSVELKKRCYEYPVPKFAACFPIDRIPQKSKVILYGAGKLGRQYQRQNLVYHFCNIVLWVDTKYENYQENDVKIENPDNIKRTIFDYVLVAIDNYYIAKDIVVYLKQLGVKQEQIVWQSTRINDREF